MPTFNAVRASYRALWNGMVVQKAAAADQAARRVLAGKPRYQTIEKSTGVPWFFIGLCHLREGNLNFETYLGNGQSIHHVTTIEPNGRGPFPSFEAGAIDALHKQGLIGIKDWSLERIAYYLEGFNGYGYRSHGVNSPYLWAGTNRYTRGKFVADHVFDANAVDQQLGSMAVLGRLAVMDADVARFITGAGAAIVAKADANAPAPAPAPVPVTPIALPAPAVPAAKGPPVQQPKHDGWFVTFLAIIGAALTGAWTWLQEWLPEILLGVAGLIVVTLIIFRLMKGRWPWTGHLSLPSSPVSLPSSVASSAQPLLDRLEALRALSPATLSPALSASRLRRKQSAPKSKMTRQRKPKSKSSRPSIRTRSSSKRRSRSRGSSKRA